MRASISLIVFLLLFSYSKNSSSQEFETIYNDFITQGSSKVDLVCTSSTCDIDYEIIKYLKIRNLFDNDDFIFNLYSGGVIVDT
ncbi:hypothetical protein GNT65_10105 [Shewanella sp. JBTF-M18]|uniref:Uncharacterized protein n=2 Tax=Shewanella insulae TaxID=2681496 RepID=A0A6L7HXG2_9GAMM|nr:hypothetical protein [Shewanella insulae]MXR69019.1 hypothetical protein [Shewanella insulae]